jgi:hypothetical protein
LLRGADPIGKKEMSEKRTLWDFLDEGTSREEFHAAKNREAARRDTVKRLRAGGHWMTLLRVAHTIRQPFTLNDISVAVWQACPEAFGMNGYPYPDNHKVHYILYGSRGLVAKGLIRRVRTGLFCVSGATSPETPPS